MDLILCEFKYKLCFQLNTDICKVVSCKMFLSPHFLLLSFQIFVSFIKFPFQICNLIRLIFNSFLQVLILDGNEILLMLEVSFFKICFIDKSFELMFLRDREQYIKAILLSPSILPVASSLLPQAGFSSFLYRSHAALLNLESCVLESKSLFLVKQMTGIDLYPVSSLHCQTKIIVSSFDRFLVPSLSPWQYWLIKIIFI